MRKTALLPTVLLLALAIAVPAVAQPLNMEIAAREGTAVITLQVGDDAEVGGRYSLDVTDGRGNHSSSSGSFAPGQRGPVATINVQADARAHLIVTLDNGTTYEREWLGSETVSDK